MIENPSTNGITVYANVPASMSNFFPKTHNGLCAMFEPAKSILGVRISEGGIPLLSFCRVWFQVHGRISFGLVARFGGRGGEYKKK